MLGTRTKQVNAYGRRQQRIVNISENTRLSSTGSELWDSVQESHAKPTPSPARIKRGRVAKVQPGTASPARPSPVKRALVKRLILKGKDSKIAPAEMKRLGEDMDASLSSRPPLSALRMNAPDSPAVIPQVNKKKPSKKAPSGLKMFDAFVDVKISVLDSEGNVEKQEHRVSRPGIQINPVRLAYDATTIALSDSEEEVVTRSQLNKRSAHIIISSDEEEDIVPPPRHQIGTSSHPILLPGKPVAKLRVQRPLSPIYRPRQLTPIRRGTLSRFQAASPAQSDISLDVSDLDLEDIDIQIPKHAASIPQYLIPLLSKCSQQESGPHEFSAFIETFPFDPIVHTGHGDVEFRKIGEASYSEVFGIGDVVLKIIPLRDEGEKSACLNSSEETPSPSDAKDVLKEIQITKAMGDTCPGFVELLRTYVVRGRYPELLLHLWDDFDKQKGSESIRPDCFNLTQTYAIIVLPNGGPDLENFVFPTTSKTCWRQACSIFWQVAKALSTAEDLVSFEHRDLHWGQILVKISQPPSSVTRKPQHSTDSKIFMDNASLGVTVTIIDLGLSRMDDCGVHLWTAFEAEVFLGEGDYQFDVYRMMKNHILDSWQGFKPLTNVMWLHYLVLKLLKSKDLRAPVIRKASTPTQSQVLERECYECLLETEKLLRKSVAPFKGKATKKVTKPTNLPMSAVEVVAYAVERLWISPE